MKLKGNDKSQLLLLDFCNIKTWNVETLLDIYKAHKIGYLAGNFGKDPWTVICKTRLDDKHNYCLEENPTSAAMHKEAPSDYLLPSDSKFNRLWDMLQFSQESYLKFLEKCISEKNLDIDFIKGVFSVYEKIHWTVREDNPDPWKPLVYPDPDFSTLETYVDLEIANAVREREENVFPYIKKCEYCKKFHKANTLREDQKYCTICSPKIGYRTSMDKDEWAEYHRTRRRKTKEENVAKKKHIREAKIKKDMEDLEISREEAIQLLEDDGNM